MSLHVIFFAYFERRRPQTHTMMSIAKMAEKHAGGLMKEVSHHAGGIMKEGEHLASHHAGSMLHQGQHLASHHGGNILHQAQNLASHHGGGIMHRGQKLAAGQIGSSLQSGPKSGLMSRASKFMSNHAENAGVRHEDRKGRALHKMSAMKDKANAFWEEHGDTIKANHSEKMERLKGGMGDKMLRFKEGMRRKPVSEGSVREQAQPQRQKQVIENQNQPPVQVSTPSVTPVPPQMMSPIAMYPPPSYYSFNKINSHKPPVYVSPMTMYKQQRQKVILLILILLSLVLLWDNVPKTLGIILLILSSLMIVIISSKSVWS